jgi:hypothetical protein
VYGIVVYVHEWGHYAVGRWWLDIPASEIRIVMTDFPQHVSLRDGEEWLSPEDPRYDEVYQQYDPGHDRAQVWLFNVYTAGGVVLQAVAVVAIAGGLLVAGEAAIAELFLEISALMIAGYVALDFGSSVLGDGQFTGDFTGHWNHSPVGTVLVVLFFAATHVPLYLTL